MTVKQSIFQKMSSLLLFFAILTGCDDVIKPMQDFKANEYPAIISFTSDLPDGTELTPNLAVTLSVEAFDPEGEPLAFEYNSEDGSFSDQNDSIDASTVTFYTAGYLTSAQSVTVSVKVTDIKGFSVSRQLELGETREGPTVTAIGTVPEYIKSTSQAVMTFSANQSGLYEVLVYDDTGVTAAWDDTDASYFYGAGSEVIITIDGPSWAGQSGNAQLVNPPDRVAVVLKDSLESVATYSFILDVDDDAPVSTVDVAGTSSLSPIPVTISSTDAKSGVSAISYTLDGSVPDFSGNGTVVSGSPAGITVGTGGVGSYTLSYRAMDNLGNLEDTKTETYIIQADVIPPGPVTDLIVTQAGGGQISLSWTGPSDSDLDHILITWVPGGATGITVPAGTTSITLTGFTTGTTYTLTVVAVDVSYNESTAGTVAITPPVNFVPVHYVGTPAELNDVRWNLGDYYIQTAAIDLSGYGNWTAIGDDVTAFTGTFDGNSYIISGISVNGGSNNYQGLFGYTVSNTRLMNITIENCTVSGYQYIGCLTGENYGVISNCHITGASGVSGENTVGGLAGRNFGRITGSGSSAVVNGYSNNNGGLIGNNASGSIENSYATGNVTGNMNNNGGLIGYNNNGSVTDCYAEGIVTGKGDYNGGLIGYNTGTGSGAPVTGSYATGNVYPSNNNVSNNGGLIGYNYGSGAPITGCYATGSIIAYADGVSNNGGLIGFNTGGIITGCYAEGNLTYDGSVTLMGPNHGGLIGLSVDSNITECYATGNVETYDDNGDNDYNGGLIGSFEGTDSVLYRSYATGSVDASFGGLCGGLVGAAFGTISESYATGNVTGFSQSGGLVGLLDTSGNISNCYTVSPFANSVYGDNTIGGLVGTNNGSVEYSYAARDLSAAGASNYGGLIGETMLGSSDSNSFYDADLCGYTDAGGSGWTVAGTPTSTANMKIQATFSGWNFSTIWGISGLINDSYPYLLNNNQ